MRARVMQHQTTGMLLAVVLLAAAGHAAAHVGLTPPQAAAGSYQTLSFKVTHGCAGSPTREVRIDLPAGVHAAKPMPKAGWSITLEKRQLREPYVSHGKSISEEVASIRWHDAQLPDEYVDEFSIHVLLPAQPGMLAIPVTQLCESGRLDWHEPPSPGRKPKAPAPVIEILPPARAGSHLHH